MQANDRAVRTAAAAQRGRAELSRRDAIRSVSALLGGAALIGQSAWLGGCAAPRPGARSLEALFMTADIELLDYIADTILPETSTPGARAAAVGPFIAVMVADTYTAQEQQTFTQGLAALEAASRMSYGDSFAQVSPQQRTQLLERLDREQYDYTRSRAADAPEHYFRMLKQLTLLGYFTSEIGCTQAQRYLEAPGRFEPCVPYSPGDRAWAAHA